jgi:hypothetical protein
MKKHAITQQIDSASGILERSRQFSAFGLDALINAQLNNHGLDFYL